MSHYITFPVQRCFSAPGTACNHHPIYCFFIVSISFITLGRLYRWIITNCKSIKQEINDVIIKIIGDLYGIINIKGAKDNTMMILCTNSACAMLCSKTSMLFSLISNCSGFAVKIFFFHFFTFNLLYNSDSKLYIRNPMEFKSNCRFLYLTVMSSPTINRMPK